VTYQYDSLNRLASTNPGSTWDEAYTYDAFGNLTANGHRRFRSEAFP